MKIDKKFINRLESLIEKYGKRDVPLEEPELFLNETDEEFIETSLNYKFYYEIREKEKDMLYMFNLEDDNGDSDKVVDILFFDENIANNLKKITEYSGLYSDSPVIELYFLYNSIKDLRTNYKNKYNNYETKLILNFIEELFKEKYNKMDMMIKENKIDYNSLWYYFDNTGVIYNIKFYDTKICMKYEYFEYVKGDENRFMMFGKVLYFEKGSIKEGYHAYSIKKFNGTRSIDSFKINTYENISDDDKKTYINYGKIVEKMSNKISYMYLKGNQYVLEKHIVTCIRDNRVIVDSEGLDKFDNKPFNFELIKNMDEEMNDEHYSIIIPFVGVYSMGTNKCWGMSHVKDLTSVKYQSDSFDYLVLEENKKSILKGLIKCHRKDLYDFIEGKGQGMIFLLNGPPGVGKTLTAEATSEFLERPLYNVNVGDLGTNPEVMEGIMERIIEYCERWGAIILIDEADIFLEEREFSNIIRNALVSTFLKFLEFNKGIMFLTTNRLKSLDEAVKSRVNMFISYSALNYNSRKNVWNSIIKKWNLDIPEKYINQVSEYKLNGREIRNYMRLVISILDDRNIDFSGKNMIKIFKECYELTNEFEQNIGESSMYM